MTQSGHPPHFHLNLRPPTDRRNNHERLRGREPRHRTDPRHLSDDDRRGAGDGDRLRGGGVPLLARGPRARAGGANPPGRQAPPRAAGRARGDHRAGDGQAPGRGPGGGGLRRRHHGVLRRQRRADHGRPADRHPGRGHRRHPPLAAGGAPGDHAVELPLLPGGAFRSPEPRGGQHDPPQARPAVPRVGGGDRAIYRDAGFPEGAYVPLYITNEQAAAVIADPRVQGVSVTGSERAGAAVAAEARSQPQEGRARAWRVRPLHPPVHRRPRRDRDRRREGAPGQHRAVVQRGQALHRRGRALRRVPREVHGGA